MRWLSLSLLPSRYPALHGLRVLGILSVVQVHVTNLLLAAKVMPASRWATLSQQVWWGMDLFFLLSGFLIGRILLDDPDRGIARAGRFWIRRALRILPAYYVVLSTLVVLAGLGVWQVPLRPFVWKEFLYLTNYLPPEQGWRILAWGWSLCVEEHFYLVAPLFVMLLRRLPVWAQGTLLCVLWLAGLCCRGFAIAASGRPFDWTWQFEHVYQTTHTRFDILVAGIGVAWLTHHFDDGCRRAFSAVPVRVLSGGLIAWGLWELTVIRPQFRMLFNTFAWGTVTSLVWGLAVLNALYGSGPVRRFLSLRAFLPVATLGYGVYLTHIPAMVLVTVLIVPHLSGRVGWPGVWGISFAASLLLAHGFSFVLHVLVEKPLLRLRDRWTNPQ